MRRHQSSALVNTICSVLFYAFAFLYLYFFQGDLLGYAQHVLSGGATVYDTFVGAVIITAVLMLLSVLSARVLGRNYYNAPSFYHLPSALILAAMIDIHVQDASGSVFGHVWIVALILFVLYLIMNKVLNRAELGLPVVTPTDVMRNLWLNLAALCVMIGGIVFCNNTNERIHLRLAAEKAISNNRYAKATRILSVNNYDDSELAMLRAISLGKQGLLGEEFFEHPVKEGSKVLFPSKENQLLVLPSMKIYQFVGGVPGVDMDARETLRLLRKRNQLKPAAKDYLYTACLLDRDLDKFVEYLSQDTDSVGSLPKHYREALTLYNHKHVNPILKYSSPEMDADFDDFHALIKKNPDKTLQYNILRDTYGNTYWFYYYFTASKALTQSVSREN